MTQVTHWNTFEGYAADGDALTAASSGGASGTAFSGVVRSAAGTAVIDATVVAHGARAAELTAPTGETVALVWTVATRRAALRWYVRLEAYPTATTQFMILRHGDGFAVRVDLRTDGRLALNARSSVNPVATLTQPVPVGAWFRAELFFEQDPGVSSGRAKVGWGAAGEGALRESTGLLAVDVVSGGDLVNAQAGKLSGAGALHLWADDVALNTFATDYIGPWDPAGYEPVPIPGPDQTARPLEVVTVSGQGAGEWSQDPADPVQVALAGAGSIRTLQAPCLLEGATLRMRFGGSPMVVTVLPATDAFKAADGRWVPVVNIRPEMWVPYTPEPAPAPEPVPLAAPTNVQIVEFEQGRLRKTWNAVDGATAYQIWEPGTPDRPVTTVTTLFRESGVLARLHPDGTVRVYEYSVVAINDQVSSAHAYAPPISLAAPAVAQPLVTGGAPTATSGSLAFTRTSDLATTRSATLRNPDGTVAGTSNVTTATTSHSFTFSGLASSTSYSITETYTTADGGTVTLTGTYATSAPAVTNPLYADRSYYPDGTGIWADAPPLVDPVTLEYVHPDDGGWPIAEWRPSDPRTRTLAPREYVRWVFPQEIYNKPEGINPRGGNWHMHAPQWRNDKYMGPSGQTWYGSASNATAGVNGFPPRPGKTYWPETGRADPGDKNRAMYMQPGLESTTFPMWRGIEDGHIKGSWHNEGIDHASLYVSGVRIREPGLHISFQNFRHDKVSVNFGRKPDGNYAEKTGGDFFQIWTDVGTLHMRNVTAHSHMQGIFLTGDIDNVDWERVNLRAAAASPEDPDYMFWLPNSFTSSRMVDVWATNPDSSRDGTIWPKGTGSGSPINFGHLANDYVPATAPIGLNSPQRFV